MEATERRITSAMDPLEEKEELFLPFRLARETYCVSIVKIKEIIEMPPITDIPQEPDFIKGVMSFRGRSVPVIDLRIRFGMETVGCSDGTSVMVVEIEGNSGLLMVGLMIDSVSEVLTIESENVEKVPEFDTMTHSNYILGLTRMEEGVKILVDVDKVLTFDELSVLDRMSGGPMPSDHHRQKQKKYGPKLIRQPTANRFF